jgi:ABC-type Fe3+-siderophore transport system permease subunit
MLSILSLFCFTVAFVNWRAFTFETTSISEYCRLSLTVFSGCGFFCRIDNRLDSLFILKLVISGCNVALGILFVYLYVKHARRFASRNDKKVNYTVLLLFLNEFVFTIAPTIIFFTFRGSENLTIKLMVFTSIPLGFALDGFVSALVYYHTRSKTSIIHKIQIVSVPVKK